MNNNSYIYAAKGITHKTNNELADMAFAGDSLESVMQEAWRRGNADLMYLLAKAENVIQNPAYCKLLSKFISTCKDPQGQLKVVEAILSHSPERVSKSFPSSLFLSLAGVSNEVAALILLSEGTPADVVTELTTRNMLNVTRTALFIGERFMNSPVVTQNKLLEAIIKMLQLGYSLDNAKTASILLQRLSTSSADEFSTCLAKYNMSPAVATIFDQKVKDHGRFNAILRTRFADNQSSGVKAYKLLSDIKFLENNLDECLKSLVVLMHDQTDAATLRYFLTAIESKCFNNDELFFTILTTPFYENFVFLEFAKLNKDFCASILLLIRKVIADKGETIYLQHMQYLDDIFNVALNSFGLRTILQSFPDFVKNYIPSLREEAPKVDTKDKDENKAPKKRLTKFLSNNITESENMNTNWYSLHKTSGKWSGGSLAAAVMALLFVGHDKLGEIAHKYNIPEDVLQQAADEQVANNFDYLDKDQPSVKAPEAPLAPTIDQTSLNIMARTLWAEARTEGEGGMRAVASVIWNRGHGTVPGMISAIKKPLQFSCWNDMDWRNFTIKEKSGDLWNSAKSIATEMATGAFAPTHSYKFYYNPDKCSPSWAYDKTGELRPHEDIGNHRFVQI